MIEKIKMGLAQMKRVSEDVNWQGIITCSGSVPVYKSLVCCLKVKFSNALQWLRSLSLTEWLSTSLRLHLILYPQSSESNSLEHIPPHMEAPACMQQTRKQMSPEVPFKHNG